MTPSASARLRRASAVAGALALAASLSACAASAEPAQSPETSAQSADFPVTITHAMGETVIPEQPKRVVALDPSYSDAALLLDAELVGYVDYRQDAEQPFADYLGDVTEATADSVSVGSIAEPDLEAIAALKPDLIISAKVRQEALYPQLSQIAPTVFSESTGPTWKENVVLLGEALGKKEKAEKAVAAYEERAAAVGEAILAENPDLSVTLIRFSGGDTARLYSSDSFIGEILTDMGLPRPESAPDTTESIFVDISPENILDVDSGLILVSTWAPEGAEGDASRAQREQFQSNPLWDRLAGEKLEVDDATFLASVSIQGADEVITTLAEHFGVDPQED
ncbi:iron-siderophore ABC transporter substrate-binding protein [Microbacterium esteraromaticum]|uniref:Iron-siderophore ABC transporter substrate-binding protein n=1 Tax=Microbacterium esteraromaticum TaxID=57043 RepID=A0A7D8AHH9_9MICO|nr:iron-siderophore ABC transporter substrate-binding protein [Microbacterium esteraromaticum]QMU95886.1 iron-siderophore ABC transporter substrate-binding protein [Microbacterium esteraromaticum]